MLRAEIRSSSVLRASDLLWLGAPAGVPSGTSERKVANELRRSPVRLGLGLRVRLGLRLKLATRVKMYLAGQVKRRSPMKCVAAPVWL
jgi:hypothetical protein